MGYPCLAVVCRLLAVEHNSISRWAELADAEGEAASSGRPCVGIVEASTGYMTQVWTLSSFVQLHLSACARLVPPEDTFELP